MTLNPNYKYINVEDSEKRQDSLLNFYRKAIAYRKGKEIISKGDFALVNPKDKNVFAYLREYESKRLLVIANYKNKPVKFKLSKNLDFSKSSLALSNYSDSRKALEDMVLREYEALVYELE
ncbi:MAG: alpha-glucosidase C-terminal domain-containing protein, partial [Clostridia bacterium]|nr:alpha-glucosidase C-terminal domain-containing protein [Clostridia bacterium]